MFKRLFGGGAPKEAPSEIYNGFTITPTPIKEGSDYRISARIDKGERSHTLIRADTLGGLEAAQQASIAKAKQLIDQMGEKLFT